MVRAALVAFWLACAGEAPRSASPAPASPAAEEEVVMRVLRDEMVDAQIAARGVKDPRVLAAVRAVPRHRFVSPQWKSWAYEDGPLPIGEDQTISQPYIVAFMSEALQVEPGMRVLEVGTGSGYQAAVLAEMGAEVWSIEILEGLSKAAEQALSATGYLPRVRLRVGDGYRGWPEEAPFDRIIVTAAPDHVPPALQEQVKPGGRLVIPVGDETMQSLRVFWRDAAGGWHEESLLPVRFVPMTGEAQKQGK